MTSKSIIAPVTVPAPGKTYTHDEAYAALCMWEEIAAPTMTGAPWQEMREAVGTAEFRNMILLFGAACDEAWTKAYDFYETAHRNWETRRQEHEARGEPFLDPQPEDPGSFDWEFVPTWLRIGVDWSDHTAGPRVRGGKSGEV